MKINTEEDPPDWKKAMVALTDHWGLLSSWALDKDLIDVSNAFKQCESELEAAILLGEGKSAEAFENILFLKRTESC